MFLPLQTLCAKSGKGEAHNVAWGVHLNEPAWKAWGYERCLPMVTLVTFVTLGYLWFPFPTFRYVFLPWVNFPYLSLPLVPFPYLSIPFLTYPYLSLPSHCLTEPYWALIGLFCIWGRTNWLTDWHRTLRLIGLLSQPKTNNKIFVSSNKACHRIHPFCPTQCIHSHY